MTIVPPHHNLSNNQEKLQRILGKVAGGGYPPADDCYHGIDSDQVTVDPSMAEDELRMSGCNKPPDQETPPSASASGSKGFRGLDEDEDDESWLQLSIGGRMGRDRNGGNKSGDGRDVLTSRGLVELDLLPPGRGSSASINKLEATSPSSTPPTIGLSIATMSSPPLLFQNRHGSRSGGGSEFPYQHPEIINWGFRPVFRGQGIVGGAVAGTSSNSSYPSSSSSSMLYASTHFGRPFQLQIEGGADRGAGPSTDVIKIIDPPRRRNSSIWFMLLASLNQDREPFLPQIPRSYLRIKDGRMTVRLLTKYLVDKLKLDSESELEITCRGQELQHDFTLQHVRDNIWSPRKDSSSPSTLTTTTTLTSVPVVTLLPDSSITQHLMILHYSRRRRITPTPTTTIPPS